MPFLELSDETLDINSSENYMLSLEVSAGGLSFCLFDTLRNKFIMIRHYEPEEDKKFTSEELTEIIKSDDYLRKRYRKINVITPSPKFTLVPAPLYDTGKMEEYYNFNHLRDENSVILANKLVVPDAFVIFSLSEPLAGLINNAFPENQLIIHLKPLLRNITFWDKTLIGKYIHVHVEKDFFNLVIFDHNILKLCNCFIYKSSKDILYHVMNVFRQMDIKQEETVHFSGNIEKYPELIPDFSEYVRRVKFAGPFGNFTFSYVFNEATLHRFLNLFSVVNCE
jgi:hypothetical protein